MVSSADTASTSPPTNARAFMPNGNASAASRARNPYQGDDGQMLPDRRGCSRRWPGFRQALTHAHLRESAVVDRDRPPPRRRLEAALAADGTAGCVIGRLKNRGHERGLADLEGGAAGEAAVGRHRRAGVVRADHPGTGKVGSATAKAAANSQPQKGYENCPACPQIDLVKAIPPSVTTFAPGTRLAATTTGK